MLTASGVDHADFSAEEDRNVVCYLHFWLIFRGTVAPKPLKYCDANVAMSLNFIGAGYKFKPCFQLILCRLLASLLVLFLLRAQAALDNLCHVAWRTRCTNLSEI